MSEWELKGRKSDYERNRDATESTTRVYTAFLMKVPRDFAGVNQVLYRAARIVVQERGARGRELTIPVDRLF